ncbi:MAG: Alpha-2-macroglobulin [Desulfovibrio sp.]
MRSTHAFTFAACLLVMLSLICFAPHDAFAKGAAPQKDAAVQKEAPAQSAPQKKPEEKKPAPKSSLKVSPGFTTSGGRAMLQFQFNKHMLDEKTQLDLLGKPMSVEDMPIIISPPFEGEAKWVDLNNLVFTSYKNVSPATRYIVTLKEGLTSVDGTKYEGKGWNWTPYPFLFRVNQKRYTADGTVTLDLLFSSDVNYAKLKDALTVTDAKGEKLPIEISPPENKETGHRVDVLVKPAELGELTVSLPEGFTGEAGPEGLRKRDASRGVKTTSMFAINTVRARQSSSPPWERFIEFRTTNSADIDQLKQYMEITPATDVKIEARSSGFVITGDFITRPRVNITFKKGTPGILGVLLEDFTSTVVFDDFAPRMAFDTKGTILSPNRSMRVPFSSINVERVQTTLWQLPENNIPLMAMGFFDSYRKHLSRKVAVRSGPINAVRNRSAESALDLTQIAGKAKGVFLLTVSDASDPQKVRSDEPKAHPTDDYYYDDDYSYDDGIAAPMEKLVVISDIGITARVMPDAITVWANSIATTEALRGARVRVFTANNVLLVEGRTDKDGLWRYQRNEDWSGRERPAIVVVSTAATSDKPQKADPGLSEASVSDIAFVKLESNLSADSAFDTGGRDYLRQGYEAFCFTPRGVFRPGETVDFKTIIRNSRMQAPEQFPIEWRVRASTGRTVGKGTAMLSAEGGAAFSLPLVASAPTGRYTMIVSLPGKSGKTLGYCTFSVEDFQPPRIEVKLDYEKQETGEDPGVLVHIDAKYLFGSPVADAPWEGSVNFMARSFEHPDWRAFYFPSRFENQAPSAVQDLSGTLDNEGKAPLIISAGKDWTAPYMNVVASVRVREDGGRWVGRNVIVPYFTAQTLLGYDFSGLNEAQAGSPCSVRFAAVTPEGKGVEGELTATVTRRESYYVRSDRGYTHATRDVPVTTGKISLKEGKGTLTFTPPQRGSYTITVATADGATKIDTGLSIWSGVAGSDDGASPLVDRVMLSWDKKSYKIGETATLNVRSPFPGKLMVVLEGEKELFRLTLPLKETETKVQIPVLTSMMPNAYCSAWVIRPVKEGETWGAHRAYGVTPLAIDRSVSKLKVLVTAPEKTLPSGEMPVSIQLADAYGQPVKGEVALAFVDEGLLSLTNFKTPDPFAFFTAKRAMQGMTFDIYDDLMPLSSRKAVTLKAGGGASEDDASRVSPMSRKLELLSIFLGTVVTDENGMAKTTLKLPEYSGRGRIMAVAVTASALGNADANVRIARDVTVEATVPRMVAPGDVFSVPVIAFGDGKKAVKATITLETEGPLSVQGEKTFSVTLDETNLKAALPLSVKAEDASGMAALRVITKIDGSDAEPFVQRLEIPVRPPFPRLAKNGSGVVKGGNKAIIDIGGGFFPGTQRVSLSFSDTPGIGLMRALDYLGNYPYGCLEQTTSAAWPYLAVPAMLKSMDPEKAKDTEYKQAVDFAVRRILSMQRSDGGFNGWPGINPSAAYAWTSVYATHFLTEAKSTGLVPDDAHKAALDWMRSYLASSLPQNVYSVMDALSVKAYICYVLALNGEAPLGWMQFLKEQGKFLTQSARIFLAGAYAVHTGKADALKELGTQPLARFGRYGWSLESSPRNEALRLLMWTHVDPFAPETATLAKRVIDDGNADRWRSTQENAIAVLAVGRYVEKTAGKSRDFTATLSTAPGNGAKAQEVATFTNKDAPTFSREILPPAPPASPYPLNVAVQGDGSAFYSWTTTGVPTTAPEPFSEGLSVYRRWVLPDGTVYDFIPDASGNLPEALRNLKIPHGTRVTVSLYVKPNAAMNSLVLADIIPGGFEIDNPNLEPDSEYASRAGTFTDPKTGKRFAPPAGFEHASPLNTYSEGRSEMRDDRLLLFADYMPNIAGVFTYTLRAVNKGDFLLPPVSAEDMYDPSIRALSPTARVVVE